MQLRNAGVAGSGLLAQLLCAAAVIVGACVATNAEAIASTCVASQVTSPNPSSQNTLLASGGISTSDVWAVGNYYPSTLHISHNLTVHWDGAAWSVVPSPNVDLRDNDNSLSGVAALTTTDVWAVGTLTRHRGGFTYQPFALRWNGSRWSVGMMPSSAGSLAGASAVVQNHNAWAVGQTYVTVPPFLPQPLVELWNRSAWSMSPTPAMQYGGLLGGVFSPSPSAAWSVGTYYDAAGDYLPLAEHWNGSAWSQVPMTLVGADAQFDGVSGITDRNAWAAGYFYDAVNNRFHSLIEHWNGTAWRVVNIPQPMNMNSELNGISAASATDVWAVGTSDDPTGPTNLNDLMMHYDGVAWSIVPSTQPPQFNYLYSVTAFPQDAWSVGINLQSVTNTLTVLSHC